MQNEEMEPRTKLQGMPTLNRHPDTQKDVKKELLELNAHDSLRERMFED